MLKSFKILMVASLQLSILADITDFCLLAFSNLRSCTVHIGNIKFFICPTNAHISYKIVKESKSFKIIIVATIIILNNFNSLTIL